MGCDDPFTVNAGGGSIPKLVDGDRHGVYTGDKRTRKPSRQCQGFAAYLHGLLARDGIFAEGEIVRANEVIKVPYIDKVFVITVSEDGEIYG